MGISDLNKILSSAQLIKTISSNKNNVSLYEDIMYSMGNPTIQNFICHIDFSILLHKMLYTSESIDETISKLKTFLLGLEFNNNKILIYIDPDFNKRKADLQKKRKLSLAKTVNYNKRVVNEQLTTITTLFPDTIINKETSDVLCLNSDTVSQQTSFDEYSKNVQLLNTNSLYTVKLAELKEQPTDFFLTEIEYQNVCWIIYVFYCSHNDTEIQSFFFEESFLPLFEIYFNNLIKEKEKELQSTISENILNLDSDDVLVKQEFNNIDTKETNLKVIGDNCCFKEFTEFISNFVCSYFQKTDLIDLEYTQIQFELIRHIFKSFYELLSTEQINQIKENIYSLNNEDLDETDLSYHTPKDFKKFLSSIDTNFRDKYINLKNVILVNEALLKENTVVKEEAFPNEETQIKEEAFPNEEDVILVKEKDVILVKEEDTIIFDEAKTIISSEKTKIAFDQKEVTTQDVELQIRNDEIPHIDKKRVFTLFVSINKFSNHQDLILNTLLNKKIITYENIIKSDAVDAEVNIFKTIKKRNLGLKRNLIFSADQDILLFSVLHYQTKFLYFKTDLNISSSEIKYLLCNTTSKNISLLCLLCNKSDYFNGIWMFCFTVKRLAKFLSNPGNKILLEHSYEDMRILFATCLMFFKKKSNKTVLSTNLTIEMIDDYFNNMKLYFTMKSKFYKEKDSNIILDINSLLFYFKEKNITYLTVETQPDGEFQLVSNNISF